MPSQSVLTSDWYRRSIEDTLGHDLSNDNVYFAFIPCPSLGIYPDPDPDPNGADAQLCTYFGPVEPNVWGVFVGPNGLALTKARHGVWQGVFDGETIVWDRVDVLDIT